MGKEIQLSKGLITIVDDIDFDKLNQYRWSAAKCGSKIYAKRSVRKIDGTWTKSYMHRELLPQSIEVDHINGNTLDNRKENLRSATKSQNMGNRVKKKKASSVFKGVRWHKSSKKWLARITFNKQELHLGCFVSETEAAKAYDTAARFYFQEFALLNFPVYGPC